MLSAVVWVAIAMILGSVARASVVRLLNTLTGSVRLLLRAQAKAFVDAADQLDRRNQAVLLEIGQQRLERRLDREFHQVWQLIDRDLAQFPHWQRQISEHISQLEEDYHKTAETPPPAPDWLDSMAAVVRLKESQNGNPAFSNVLKHLESDLNRQHEQALHSYRKSMSHRHRLLHGMMPQWRKLSHAIERVRTGIRSLLHMGRDIDRHMEQYQGLLTGGDQPRRALQVSLFVEGILSAVLVLLWLGVAWLSFNLMSAPLQTMMAPGEPLAGMAMADWAGLMLLGVSIAMGWVLMELLRITRVFDGLYGLDAPVRRRLVWVLVGLLVLSALAQAGLVYLHQRAGLPTTELERLIQYPVIVYEAPLLDQGLVLGARMVLAFVLPLILIFFAVPFERLLHSLRISLVVVIGFALRFLAWVLRLASGWLWYVNRALQAVYDVFISLPLWVALRVKPRAEKPTEQLDTAAEMHRPV
ncbi:hypothetical protein [Saccharospirillum sp.]|uniref:hypothetical protein n=1 Tax=Saccharospirillum sp. TaxID=2033801 RepID=UPI0034A08356